VTGIRSLASGLLVLLFGGLALACARAASGPSPLPAPPIDCSLMATGPFRVGAPIPLGFTLVNRGEKPIFALRWYTPLEGFRGDLFTVTPLSADGGGPLSYQGPMVKRGDPVAEDYVELAPGVPAQGTIDLGLAYDLHRPGAYSVEFRRGLADRVDERSALPRPRDAHQPGPLTCAPLRIEIVP